MARLSPALLAALPLLAALARPEQVREEFPQAGVCARCHVVSVLEWGLSSRHRQVGTDCNACHGASQGHVMDERNGVNPERVPHAAAIAGLCANCHTAGCPKTRATAVRDHSCTVQQNQQDANTCVAA